MVRRTRAQTRIQDHFKPSTPETRWPAGSARPTRGRKPVYESESESEGSEGMAAVQMTQKLSEDDGEDDETKEDEEEGSEEDEEEALSPMKRRRMTDRSKLRRPDPKVRPEPTISMPVINDFNDDSDEEQADDEVEAVIDGGNESGDDWAIPVDEEGDVIILEEPPDSFGGDEDVIKSKPATSGPPHLARGAKRSTTKSASLQVPRSSNGASSSRTPVVSSSPVRQGFRLSKQKLQPYVEIPSRSPSVLSTRQSQPPLPAKKIPRVLIAEPEFALGELVSDHSEADAVPQLPDAEGNVPLVVPPSTGKKRQRSLTPVEADPMVSIPVLKSRNGAPSGGHEIRASDHSSPIKDGKQKTQTDVAVRPVRDASPFKSTPRSEPQKKQTVTEETASRLKRGLRVDYDEDGKGIPENELLLSERSGEEIISTPKNRTPTNREGNRQSRGHKALSPVPLPVNSRKEANTSSFRPSRPPAKVSGESEASIDDKDDDDVLPELDLQPLINPKKVTARADSTSKEDVAQRASTKSNGKPTNPSRRTAESARNTKGKQKQTAYEKAEKNREKPTTRRPVDSSSDDGEGAGVALEDLEMDEPARFKTKSRLRNKPTETAFQRRLRKLKEKKMGIEKDTSESESEDENEDEDESDTSDSAAEEFDEEEFIVDDGDEVKGQLPAQFSNDRNQSPEFKFKVVFQYFVMLVIKGPSILPLKGDAAEYFPPFINDLRRLIQGHRDSRVRSQIWRTEFVQALQAFPIFHTMHNEFTHDGCDACHMSGRVSHWEVTLEGTPYDKETHEPLDSGSDSDSSDDARKGPSASAKAEGKEQKNPEQKLKKRRRRESSESVSDEEPEDLPRKFFMGRFCKARSEVYHAMSHWEDELYLRVRGYYKDLLRAKDVPLPSDSEATSSSDDSEEDEVERQIRRDKRRARAAMTAKRVRSLKNRRDLPKHKDVNNVTEWMDRLGWQANDFRWFNDMITRSERLEYDKRTDE